MTATPLETLDRAVRDYVHAATGDPARVLRGAVVVWETMKPDPDTDNGWLYGLAYATTEATSVAEGVGLLRFGLADMLTDIQGQGRCG